MFMDISYQFKSSVQNKIVERHLNFKLAIAVLIVGSMLGMRCSEM